MRKQSARRAKVAVWRTFMEVHARVLQRLGEELTRRHGLSVTEFDILVNLLPGAARQQELAERIILSQSGCSRLVDRLATSGLVEKRPAATDRRGVESRLTAEGRTLTIAAARTNAEVVEREFADRLDDDELDQLGRVLATLDPRSHHDATTQQGALS
jgi:DNA-binding MarR family transcriptional regulator